MSSEAWILMGFAAAIFGRKIVNGAVDSVLSDSFLGLFVALAGGLLLLGVSGIAGFFNLVLTTTGAIMLLSSYYGLRRVQWAKAPTQ